MAAVIDIAVMRVNNEGVAEFTFGQMPMFISGKKRVAQHFLFTLLTKPGSIFTSPGYGAGLTDLLPASYRDEAEIHTAVAAAVAKAQRDIVAEQARHPTEPADRLASVAILSARIDRSVVPVTYYLKLQITTESGDSEIIEL